MFISVPYTTAALVQGEEPSTSPGTSGAAAGCAPGSAEQSLWSRLRTSYQSHLTAEIDPTAPPTTFVDGPEVPEANPPWPYAAWNVGGTPVIGIENLYQSALMDAIDCGPSGQAWKDSRITIYGWVQPGGNISTSRSRFNYTSGTGGNYPAAYSYQPNTAQIDQVAVYFERTPDEVQREHFDWGFRVTALYGTDYKYTFSNGILSGQYTDKGRQYGFDPVMYYMDFWFPKVAQGMNLRVGRYISIPDVEAQLAPNNITYSHSLLYTYDPYTQHGTVATVKLNKNWQVQAELSAGNDTAPWIKREAQVTPAACVIWNSDSGKDSIYPCMNGLNDSKFRWNNVQHAVTTWYHKFNAKWHMDTEIWYMWESQVPNVASADGAALLNSLYGDLKFGAPSGALCPVASSVKCYSYAWAMVNYINYQIGPRDIVSWRSDFLNDARGQRTGFKTRYYEFDLGYTHWVGDVIELRPELRFEHARDAAAYDNPQTSVGQGRHSQLMLAADAIFHF
jgi:hypothetical protein